MRTTTILTWLVVATAAPAEDQTARDEFRKEVARIYDYLPADVPEDVRVAKSKEMDAFWNRVAADPDRHLPLLRDALRDEKQNAFFCFDGSALLLRHSKAKSDFELANQAVLRARPKDLAWDGHFRLVHRICREEVDAFPLVARFLDEPRFGFYLPQHAIRIGQQDAVLLCLACLGEERWVERLVKRSATETDLKARKTVAYCLAYAVKPEADEAVRRMRTRSDADLELREWIDELEIGPGGPELAMRSAAATRVDVDTLLDRWVADGRMPIDISEEKQKDALHLFGKGDEARIRAARRKVAARVSDESLWELSYLTLALRCSVTAEK